MSDVEIREHLQIALEHLLTALAAGGGLSPPTPPLEALDMALGADGSYQETRRQLSNAVQDLMAETPVESHRRLVLAVEEAANHQATVAVEVGWKVGMTAGCQSAGSS